jgi:tryptophanyl-tRNA synthetase
VVIFSGIQPTGTKHLGNYIGAITQYVAGQDRGDPAIYCIVDLHATTVPYEPATLRESTKDLAALLIAAGLETDRCILFRQSDVQEHTELTWLLSSVVPLGELNRMHQFRDKSAAQREGVSAGLLFYPVLMAADVLAYRAHEVPVGEDQREHLELMRDAATRFNNRFGDILVVPEQRTPTVGARIRDLQEPDRKMSTTGASELGTAYVLDSPEDLRRKIMKAQADSGREVVRREDKPGISNLIEIMAAARGIAPEQVEREFEGSGYGDFKAAVADAVVDWLAPVRERYPELRADEDQLEGILESGADRARAITRETLADVREAMGVGPRGKAGDERPAARQGRLSVGPST